MTVSSRCLVDLLMSALNLSFAWERSLSSLSVGLFARQQSLSGGAVRTSGEAVGGRPVYDETRQLGNAYGRKIQSLRAKNL